MQNAQIGGHSIRLFPWIDPPRRRLRRLDLSQLQTPTKGGKCRAKILILEKGFTQKQICTALGFTAAFLSQLLDGKSKGDNAMNRIAAYLNIPRQRLDRLIRRGKERLS